MLCANCYETIQFTHLQADSGVLTCAQYKGAVRSLITTMKFKNAQGVCKFLADLAYYTIHFPSVDSICAVPLHPRRKNQRGFDQAEQIAKQLGLQLKVPYIPLLVRTIYHTPQSGVKNKSERSTRLAGAYGINTKQFLKLERVASKNKKTLSILLVDDVYTTGATTGECKKALTEYFKKKNIKECIIHALCIAHD